MSAEFTNTGWNRVANRIRFQSLLALIPTIAPKGLGRTGGDGVQPCAVPPHPPPSPRPLPPAGEGGGRKTLGDTPKPPAWGCAPCTPRGGRVIGLQPCGGRTGGDGVRPCAVPPHPRPGAKTRGTPPNPWQAPRHGGLLRALRNLARAVANTLWNRIANRANLTPRQDRDIMHKRDRRTRAWLVFAAVATVR